MLRNIMAIHSAWANYYTINITSTDLEPEIKINNSDVQMQFCRGQHAII